jgi:hypothetical protein
MTDNSVDGDAAPRNGRQKPPATVIVTVILVGLLTAATTRVAVAELLNGDILGLVPLAIAAGEGLVAFGLWRGNRAARAIAAIFAGGSILAGLGTIVRGESAASLAVDALLVVMMGVLLVLLVKPTSTRLYFAQRA